MNTKILIALGALVLIAGFAIFQVNKRSDDSGALDARKSAGDKLGELDKDKVDELEVRAPEQEPIIIRKQKGTWRITAPYDAETDSSTVENAIEKLSEMTVRRVAANNPDNHAALEVDDAKGIRVVARGGGEVLRDIVIGSFGGGEQMVRIQGQDPVLAVDQSLRWVFNKPLKDWRNKTISDETAANAVKIDFEQPDARWTFLKEGETWKQVEPKKPIEKFDSTTVASMVTTLSRLSAVDFAEPSMTPEQAGLVDGASKVTITYSVPAGTDAGSQAADAGAAASNDIGKELVLFAGNEKDGNLYVRRQDGKLIYLVSSFTAEKLKPNAEAFAKSEEPEDGPGMAGSPGGIQMAPGQQGNIPPDVMAKIQAQLQAQK